jgi:hypothetical protein
MPASVLQLQYYRWPVAANVNDLHVSRVTKIAKYVKMLPRKQYPIGKH